MMLTLLSVLYCASIILSFNDSFSDSLRNSFNCTSTHCNSKLLMLSVCIASGRNKVYDSKESVIRRRVDLVVFFHSTP